MLAFQKILCPIDFSEAAFEGLAKAIELAAHSATEVAVLHVVQPVCWPQAGIVPDTQSEAAKRAEAVTRLCAVLAERVPKYVRTRPLLKLGEVAPEIVRAAREEGADLIVMTTHGFCGWKPDVLGTVAEAVLRTSPCPVLVINEAASGTWQESPLNGTIQSPLAAEA